MITICRKLEFDAAHRVMGHESKCATLHGHRYVVEITATAPDLDFVGRVIDFSVIKNLIGGWLDKCWDHTSLIYENDEETKTALEKLPQTKPVFVCPFNPTAENMADYLLKEVCPALLGNSEVKVIKVRVWETPNCYAEATL